jgi:hypothetical protein
MTINSVQNFSQKKGNIASFSVRSFVLIVVILYASTTIFTPKIGIFWGPVYFFEPIFLVTVSYLIAKGRLVYSSRIETTYFVFVILTLLTYFQGPVYTGEIDVKAFFLIVKFSMFVMMIPVVRYLNGAVTDRIFFLVFYSQILFVLLFGSYVVFNMLVNPINLEEMSFGYSTTHRLIGFTGHAIDFNHIYKVGHTSVQMGVYTGFLFLLCLSLYVHLKRFHYLVWALIMFFGSMLTYSRSGLLVIVLGVLYLIFEMIMNRRVIAILFTAITSLVVLSLFYDLLGILTSFGSLGKVVESGGYKDGSSQDRIMFWLLAINYMYQNPFILLFGTGYGEIYTTNLLGISTLESLILETLFQSGVFVLAVLLVHFYYLWRHSNTFSKNVRGNKYRAILYGCKLYIPGLLTANLVGGNSLQTDFIAPFYYFTMGVCFYRLRKRIG